MCLYIFPAKGWFSKVNIDRRSSRVRFEFLVPNRIMTVSHPHLVDEIDFLYECRSGRELESPQKRFLELEFSLDQVLCNNVFQRSMECEIVEGFGSPKTRVCTVRVEGKLMGLQHSVAEQPV